MAARPSRRTLREARNAGTPVWGTADSAPRTAPGEVSDTKGPELLQGIAKPKTLVAWKAFLVRYLRGWGAGVLFLILAIVATDPDFLGRGFGRLVPLLLVALVMGTPFALVTDLVLRDTVTRRAHLLVATVLGASLAPSSPSPGDFRGGRPWRLLRGRCWLASWSGSWRVSKDCRRRIVPRLREPHVSSCNLDQWPRRAESGSGSTSRSTSIPSLGAGRGANRVMTAVRGRCGRLAVGISPTDARAAIRSSRLERLTPSPGQPIICLAPKRAWRIAVIGTPRVGERDDRPHGATSAQIATLKASLSSRPA